MTPVIDAVLLDFFGTLVDYSPSRITHGYERSDAILRGAGCALAYDQWLAVLDETAGAMDRVADSTGVEFSMFELFDTLARQVGVDHLDDEIAANFVGTYLDEWSAAVQIVDGAPAFLRRLVGAGRTLVLVTNTHSAPMVHGHLATMGIDDVFHSVVTSVEVGFRKPRVEIFEAALAACGASAEHAVFVGDSYTPDYVGPTSLGIDAYLIAPDTTPSGPISADVPADRRLRSLLDLERALAHR